MYKVTLADGFVLDNLELNGNNFISDTPIDEHVFDDNLVHVTFYDYETEMEDVHDHMMLARFAIENNQYWFALIDIPESELRYAKNRADIEYLAMMTDVEL